MATHFPVGDHLSPRQQARVVALDCWVSALQNQGDMGDAIRLFEERWNTAARKKAGTAILAAEHYVPYQVHKLYEHGTLLDTHDQPHPKKMPDAKVKEAADILAAGYTLPCSDDSTGVLYLWDEHRHFTSIREALLYSQPLSDLLTEYDATPRYLLDRMHEVCPDLVYSALPLKMELTPLQKLARAEHAAWMLEQLERDPLFLHKIIWGDETRIYVGKEINGKLKVYHYTGQTAGMPPGECSLLNRENMIRLDVLLFVNAELGCCHAEFTTGTTDIRKDGRSTLYMRLMEQRRNAEGKGCYKTKKSKYRTAAKAMTAEEFADNLSAFLPMMQQQALDPGRIRQVAADRLEFEQFRYLVSVDNASIHDPRDSQHSLGWPATWLSHPAHSPDLHQVIEHRFAEMKQHIINRIYQYGWHRCNAQVIRQFVLEYCSGITPEKIQADLENLKLCYKIVAAPAGQVVTVGQREYLGTGGGWPAKRFR